MSDKEQIVDKIHIYGAYGSDDLANPLIGFDDEHYINKKVELDYTDKTTDCLRIENLTTNVFDNPLTGFKEVTVKLYLKGEDE